MSVGKIKEDHDANGGACKVVDVVINPNIAKAMETDVGLKDFFQNLLLTYMNEKYKI